MKRRIEILGYQAVWWLALRKGPVARWLHDHWSAFFYRHYCPYPTIKHSLTAKACIAAGACGCDNSDLSSGDRA